MSSRSTKVKPGQFGSDIHKLLQAAEAGQKADILAYSSGHLGPRSLVLSQPHKETKQPFWSTSEKHRQTPKHITLRKQPSKAVKNNMRDSFAEITADFASLTIDQTLATDHPNDSSFDAVPRADACLNNPLPCMRKPLPKIQTKSTGPKTSDNTSSQRVTLYRNDKGLSKKEQTKKPRDIVKNNIWGWTNSAEVHERKLETELQKLSSQRWPSRDRLNVFSDVFGDVCESSLVFGHILREIKVFPFPPLTNTFLACVIRRIIAEVIESLVRQTKVEQPVKPVCGTSAKATASTGPIHKSMRSLKTDYDLYGFHMMTNLENMPSQHSLKRPGTAPTLELEDKEEEVRLLEQKARAVLDENERLKAELQAVLQSTCPEDKKSNDASLSELESESADGRDTVLQSKRRQVLDLWTEIQQLEEEIRDKLVSTDITTAIDKRVRALKTELMKLMVSSNKLENTNEDLEDKINTVLRREKISSSLQQRLWDEIRPNL